MSRYIDSDYDDEYAVLNWGRWERNTKTTLASKRGQVVLREIEQALTSMAKPELIESSIYQHGEACVLGAYAAWLGLDTQTLIQVNVIIDEALEDGHDALTDTAEWAERTLGLAYTLAWNLVFENDENVPETATPTERHAHMLAFVRAHIKPEAE